MVSSKITFDILPPEFGEPNTFEILYNKLIKIKEGWGVLFDPIYTEEDRITDIEPHLFEINRNRVKISGNIPCVESVEGVAIAPIDLFKDLEDLWEDDTHDFRPRWFKTKEEAEKHITYTVNRWKHPKPWESFIRME